MPRKRLPKGAHWVTIGGRRSPLHGRHILIDETGRILGGRVPRRFHGRLLGDVGVLGSLVEAVDGAGESHIVAVDSHLPKRGEYVSLVPGVDFAELLQQERDTMAEEVHAGHFEPRSYLIDNGFDPARRAGRGVLGIPWWRKHWSRERVLAGLKPTAKGDFRQELDEIAEDRLFRGRNSIVDGPQGRKIARVADVLEVVRGAVA